MDFESMIGTGGIASSYNKLYIVNNKVITILDQYGNTDDIEHDFDWITSITTSEIQLFGIYSKSGNYGIFSMGLDSHFFKMIPVKYTPVNLIYLNQLIIVVDSNFKTYEYERNLVLRDTKERNSKLIIENPIKFMTIGLAKDEFFIYYSKDKDVYSEKEKLFSVDGNVLSMVYYQDFLFVIYVSLYNHYSISQYDIKNKKNIKTIEGGHISGPPIYSCVYESELYISASTNNKISLDLFNLPGKKTGDKVRPPSVFSMLELNKLNNEFLTEELNIDVEKIKELKRSVGPDTTPAKNTLIRYYIWVFILLFIITVIVLAFFLRENSVLPTILLSILFIALSFLIKNRYFI
jgi:hypothetical protein